MKLAHHSTVQTAVKSLRDAERIIVRRSRYRRQPPAFDGSAWKIALADFTLALMGLFLVLWLMNIAPKERLAVASRGPKQQEATPKEMVDASHMADPVDLITARDVLLKRLAHAAGSLSMSDAITMSINDDSVRIAIHDADTRSMFDRREDHINPPYVALLAAIATVLKQMPNKIMIIGHSDAARYADETVMENNWGLSSRRALRARRALRDGGVAEAQLVTVSGMGDSAPATPDDPEHGRNRRVELVILNANGEAELRRLFGMQYFAFPAAIVPTPAASTTLTPATR